MLADLGADASRATELLSKYGEEPAEEGGAPGPILFQNFEALYKDVSSVGYKQVDSGQAIVKTPRDISAGAMFSMLEGS